jgi:hypothetical protein
MRTTTKQDGITLLITLLLMGVLLGVSTSLLNITLKQFQLSGIALASEMAFQAANAGMECALYYDFPPSTEVQGNAPFDIPLNGGGRAQSTIWCMNVQASTDITIQDGSFASGEEQHFTFSWGTAPFEVCTDFSVYKFSNANNPVDVVVNGVDMRPNSDCPAGSVCTVIQSRGYNVACSQIGSATRVVEREYTQVY